MSETSAAARLASLMDERRLDLGLRWKDVNSRAGITHQTMRMVRAGRKVEDRTRRGVEKALGWAPGSIQRVLDGGDPLPAPSPRIDTRLGADVNRRRIEQGLDWDQLARDAGISDGELEAIVGGEKEPDNRALAGLDSALRWEPGSARSVHEGGHPRVLPLPGRTPDPNPTAPYRLPPPAFHEDAREGELRWDPHPAGGRTWWMMRIVDGVRMEARVYGPEDKDAEWAMKVIKENFAHDLKAPNVN